MKEDHEEINLLVRKQNKIAMSVRSENTKNKFPTGIYQKLGY